MEEMFCQKTKKINVNDSVIVDLKTGKINEHLPLKTGSKVYIVGGSHLGSRGTVEKVNENNIKVRLGDKSFELKVKSVHVVK